MTAYTDVLEKLRLAGESPDEVADLVVALNTFAAYGMVRVYDGVLTKEDWQEIDKIESDKEAEKKIQGIYEQRSGKTVNEAVGILLDKLAQTFWQEYEQTKSLARAKQVVEQKSREK